MKVKKKVISLTISKKVDPLSLKVDSSESDDDSGKRWKKEDQDKK